MTERIEKLTELTLSGEMYVNPVKTEFDVKDLLLPREKCDVKRLCEYIVNQEPKITEYSRFTGFFRFDGSVVGDAFNRGGYRETQAILMKNFYCKNIDGISTNEWQHATADYKRVLEKGIVGIIGEIDDSISKHTKQEEIDYLESLKKVAEAFIAWGEKCSERVSEFAERVKKAEHRENLERLSAALLKVPKTKPSSFYEAVLAIYICYSADPDSVGTLDRYLAPFYEKDLADGTLTRDEAKQYLQELFLMLQAKTSVNSPNFTRGGESHFCIGGYLPNGEDAFCDISRLIVESLAELPIFCPQITLRWTEKTPHEVFRFVLDTERHDRYKRFAFTNDEKRLKCYTEICGIPFETATGYTTVGCNEPAFLGSITGGNSKGNILRCVTDLFRDDSEKLAECADFDEFFALFEKKLCETMDIICDYDDKYNLIRARDTDYVSSLFFNGCIENALSLTKGGGRVAIASPMLLGITNVIDSLIVVKQFVFDEKRVAMTDLIAALNADWKGFEELRETIIKTGHFFGNDDETSNSVARRFYDSMYRYLKDKTNVFGYHFLIGDLVGYNDHHRQLGTITAATPDGRRSGDMLKFGFGQSEGRDRSGLTALLNSLAKADPHAIACGSTVTNISLDPELVGNDESFEKLVYLFETYFKNGGVHFQLTYVSKEDLLNAKKTPENYANLRVRVTGFSDYFVRLSESMQNDIIKRTEQR